MLEVYMYYEKDKNIRSLDENYNYMVVASTVFSLILFNLSYIKYDLELFILLLGNTVIVAIGFLGYLYRKNVFKKVLIFTLSLNCFTYNILLFAFSLTDFNYYIIHIILTVIQIFLILYTLSLSRNVNFSEVKKIKFKPKQLFDRYVEKNIFLKKELMYIWALMTFSVPITAFINLELSVTIFILALIIAHIAFISSRII